MQRTYPIILIAGTMTGVLSFFWFIGVYYIGSNPFYSFPQKLSILIQAFAAFGSIWYFRKTQGNGLLSFGEGIFIGLGVACITALLSSVGMYVFATFVKPEMVQHHIMALISYLQANKAELINRSSAKMYAGNLKAANEVSAYSLALDEFIWKIVRGLMFSILVSLVLRRTQAS